MVIIFKVNVVSSCLMSPRKLLIKTYLIGIEIWNVFVKIFLLSSVVIRSMLR